MMSRAIKRLVNTGEDEEVHDQQIQQMKHRPSRFANEPQETSSQIQGFRRRM